MRLQSLVPPGGETVSASTFFSGLFNWFYECFDGFSPSTNFVQFIFCCLVAFSFLGIILSFIFKERS